MSAPTYSMESVGGGPFFSMHVNIEIYTTILCNPAMTKTARKRSFILPRNLPEQYGWGNGLGDVMEASPPKQQGNTV